MTREHAAGNAVQPWLDVGGEIVEPPPGDCERLRHDLIGALRSAPRRLREDAPAVLPEHALEALHTRPLRGLLTLPHSSTMAGTLQRLIAS